MLPLLFTALNRSKRVFNNEGASFQIKRSLFYLVSLIFLTLLATLVFTGIEGEI